MQTTMKTLITESFFSKIVIHDICFSVNIPKFYRTPVLQNVSKQLLMSGKFRALTK